MFDFLFPKEWSTLKKLIWLKASGIVGAAYQTFTGTIARFIAPSSKPVKSIVCNIEPVQDLHGYDNPWPPGGGKNKLNLSRTVGTPASTGLLVSPREMATDKYYAGLRCDNYYYPNYIQSHDVSGTSVKVTTLNNTRYGVALPVEVSDNTQYTLSATLSGAMLSVGAYDSVWNFLSEVMSPKGAGDVPFSFTTPSNTAYLTIIVSSSVLGTEGTATNIQLEAGSTATSFAPFENICPISGFTGLNVYGESEYDPTASPKVAVTWQSEAGTVYAGYCSIDKDGNVTLTGTWAKIAFKPNKISTWMDADASRATLGFYLNAGDFNAEYSAPKANNVIFEEYRKASAYANENAYVSQFVFINGAFNRFEARVPKSELDAFSTYAESQAAVLAYLEDNPIAMCYELASPVTYTLSSVTVPSTVQGENNWWHDANGEITIEAIGTPIPDEPDALQALNILLGGAYTPRSNFSEPTDEQALNIIMGGSR